MPDSPDFVFTCRNGWAEGTHMRSARHLWVKQIAASECQRGIAAVDRAISALNGCSSSLAFDVRGSGGETQFDAATSICTTLVQCT